MARFARIVMPEMPHHVIQRGNRRQDVFFQERDREVYLRLLRAACQRHGVVVWAWCLMRNHVHVVAVPRQAESLARCFADTHVRYTRYINRREGWQGHLWQARFGSSVMDERYLLAVVRYVECNPVRAGLVRWAWQYRWSSAAWHVGGAAQDPLVTGDQLLRGLITDWRQYLSGPQDEQELATIRQDTVVSRPLGSTSFIAALEQQEGHRLTRRKSGPLPRRNSVAVPVF